MVWGVGKPISGKSKAGTPVVSLRRPTLRIDEIQFATSRTGSTDFHWFYRNSNRHASVPASRSLQWWGRGSKVTDPEWVRKPSRNWRACFTRNGSVAFAVKLVARTTLPVVANLTVTPTLDGSTAHLKPASVTFVYLPFLTEHWVNVDLGGKLPDEVGRYILRLTFNLQGSGFRFAGPQRTQHRIYAAYGTPLKPEYDSASTADTGQKAARSDGTVSGTRKRLDHLMLLIGGRMRRHNAASQADLVDLYWRLHKGINDTPGAPPYFDGRNAEHISTEPAGGGTELPLRDQWIAWVRNSRSWNDASCIGHVQLAKTMLAAIGLFARRVWVFPHTTRLPNGHNVSFSDTDYYSLGTYDPAKTQKWTFTHNATSYVATPYLMEPDSSWEYYEACMLSPVGKFLTGGYNTRSNPASFRANKGFNSAAELLHWWCNTSRSGFGKRFMCWVYDNEATGETHCWDVEGTHYDFRDYVRIRNRGKQLPPPPP